MVLDQSDTDDEVGDRPEENEPTPTGPPEADPSNSTLTQTTETTTEATGPTDMPPLMPLAPLIGASVNTPLPPVVPDATLSFPGVVVPTAPAFPAASDSNHELKPGDKVWVKHGNVGWEYECLLYAVEGNGGFVFWDWKMGIYKNGSWEALADMGHVFSDPPPRKRGKPNYYDP